MDVDEKEMPNTWRDDLDDLLACAGETQWAEEIVERLKAKLESVSGKDEVLRLRGEEIERLNAELRTAEHVRDLVVKGEGELMDVIRRLEGKLNAGIQILEQWKAASVLGSNDWTGGPPEWALAALKGETAELAEKQPSRSMEPNYKAFAIELMSGFPDDFCDVDGFDLQELAAKHGLLLIEQTRVPCGERCQCLESFNEGDLATCYRVNWR